MPRHLVEQQVHCVDSFLEEKQVSTLGSDVWIQVIRRGPTGREQ